MTAGHDKRIVVLGVGNILLKDEGVGVRVIQRLEERYHFSPSVELVDGGVLGLSLLGKVREAGRLIVVDAIRRGNPPGTLYSMSGEEIPNRIYTKTSLHQVDLVEALTICRVMWGLPPTVILGVEPQDIGPWGVELTPVVSARMEELVQMVLAELSSVGVYCEEMTDQRRPGG
jgi:hydrogenase maturation protease